MHTQLNSVNILFKIGRDVFMGRGIAARDFDLKNGKEELEIFWWEANISLNMYMIWEGLVPSFIFNVQNY